jgi:p38 MAP kinase
MLVYNPAKRISANDALSLPYLGLYHDLTDERVVGETFNWRSVDACHSFETWRHLMYEASQIAGSQSLLIGRPQLLGNH